MPIYEYLCKKCNKKEEIKVEVEKRDEIYCKECNSKLERAISKNTKFFFKHNIFLDGKAQ